MHCVSCFPTVRRNSSKLASVLAFIGGVVSITAAPTSGEHDSIRNVDEKGIDYKDNAKYQNPHIEQFENHTKETELQDTLIEEDTDEYEFDDGEVSDKVSVTINTSTLISIVKHQKYNRKLFTKLEEYYG